MVVLGWRKMRRKTKVGCCAAALGSSIPGSAARLSASGPSRSAATAIAVSASVASPRICFFTLNLFTSLHSAVLVFVLLVSHEPRRLLSIVHSLLAPQAPEIFLISSSPFRSTYSRGCAFSTEVLIAIRALSDATTKPGGQGRGKSARPARIGERIRQSYGRHL